MSVLVDLLSFLANAALVAVLVIGGVLIFFFLAALVWLIVDDHKRRFANHGDGARLDPRDRCLDPRDPLSRAFAETTMAPLAVDLATVETLTDVQAVSPASSSAFPLYTPPAPPSAPALPPVGSPLAVLDGRPDNAAAASNASEDANWPPPPRKPGAKTYRYIASMDGRLVRLSDLHRLEMHTLSAWELN